MKKKIFFGVLMAILAITPFYSYGATFEAEQNFYLEPTSKIDDNLYAVGSNVNIAGSISGDLFTAGSNVVVFGPIEGDILSVGSSVNLNGKISGDARVIGGNVFVSNSIGGELIILGGQLNVANGSSIIKNVELIGGSIDFSGDTKGDLDAKGETVYINGDVVGNLSVKAREIKLGPNARVTGNFEYYSQKEAVMEDGAKISGETNFHQVDMGKKSNKLGLIKFLTIALLLKLLTIIVITLIALYFCKKHINTILGETMDNFWKQTGRGFVLLVVVPVASVISFITVIGAPLGLMALLSYIVLLIASVFVTVLVFAKLAMKYVFKKTNYELNWWVVILSTLVLAIISVIPVVGFIFTFILFLSAFGALTSHIYKKLKE